MLDATAARCLSAWPTARVCTPFPAGHKAPPRATIWAGFNWTAASETTPAPLRCAQTDAELTGATVNLAGYPGTSGYTGNDLYRAFGSIDSVTSGQLRYSGTLDTLGGMSGSPVWRYNASAGERYLVGVHAKGGSSFNAATRLTSGKLSTIISSIAADPPPADKPALMDYDSWFGAQSASLSATSVAPGQSLTLASSVFNGGTRAGSSVKVNFYASTNTTISSADHLIGSSYVNVAPYSRSVATWTGAFPGTIPAGSYYVGWQIDPDNTVLEFADGANTGQFSSATKLSVTAGQPKLVGASLAVSPSRLAAGDAFDASFRVRNDGAAAAGAFDVKFYISSNSIISTADRLLGAYRVSGLAADTTSAAMHKSLALPARGDSFWNVDGTYYIGMMVNPSLVASEVTAEVADASSRNAPVDIVGAQFATFNLIGRDASGQWKMASEADGVLSSTALGAWDESAGWRDVVTGDFNGDGQTDVVSRTATGQWWLGGANGDSSINEYLGAWDESAGWRDVTAGDFNGDGRLDIVGRTATGQWWLGQNTGASFVNVYLGAWDESANWRDVMTGDFNGDGRLDIVGRTATGQWWLGQNVGTSFVNVYLGAWDESANWRDVMTGDFNGDGRLDIVGRTATGQWWLGQNTGAALVEQLFGDWSDTKDWRDVGLGDFDGDGRLDVIGRTAGGAWRVGRNTGSAFENQIFGAWDESAGWRDVFAADLNHDGRTDVIGRTASGQWWLGASDGAELVNHYLGVWSATDDWRDVSVLPG